MRAGLLLTSLLVAAGCGTNAGTSGTTPDASAPSSDAQGPVRIVVTPGESIGGITLGSTYGALRADHGPLDQLFPFNRFIVGKLPALGIEVLVASSDASTVSEDAVVIGVGVLAADGIDVEGPARPGMTRAEVEAALGVAPERVEGMHYYPLGIGVEYTAEGVSRRVAVFRAYTLTPEPPPMEQAVP